MSDPVTIGIGMMIAGIVADKADLFGEDFGKALMIGGAVVAMNPGGAFGGEAAAATEAGVSGAASELGAASMVPEIGAGATDLAVSDAALTEGLAMPGSEALGSTVGAGMTPSAAPMFETEAAGLLSETAVPPAQPWYQGQGGMMAAMVGGQAVSGMAQAKAAEEAEKKRIEEEKRKDALKSYWGRNKGGDLSVDLNLGEGLTAVNNRFFNDRNRNRGLLS